MGILIGSCILLGGLWYGVRTCMLGKDSSKVVKIDKKSKIVQIVSYYGLEEQKNIPQNRPNLTRNKLNILD